MIWTNSCSSKQPLARTHQGARPHEYLPWVLGQAAMRMEVVPRCVQCGWWGEGGVGWLGEGVCTWPYDLDQLVLIQTTQWGGDWCMCVICVNKEVRVCALGMAG